MIRTVFRAIAFAWVVLFAAYFVAGALGFGPAA